MVVKLATIDILKFHFKIPYHEKGRRRARLKKRKTGSPTRFSAEHKTDSKQQERIWMTIKEMGDLLGLKKTDRYWLVHKNVFETKTLYGKMWVNIASFEKWYANQVKYQKITGEEPGVELKAWSYSVRDAAEMLGIPEDRVYELIKEKRIKTVTVDYVMRIPKKAFSRWYQGQKHYRTAEDRERDRELEEATLSFPQAAALLGMTRTQFYPILKRRDFSTFFDIVEIAGKRKITKESFRKFLEGQDTYRLATEENRHPDEPVEESQDERAENKDQSKEEEPVIYLSLAEAAAQAHISRQAISKHIAKGSLGDCRQGRSVRIPKDRFEAWMKKRKEEVESYGIDQRA